MRFARAAALAAFGIGVTSSAYAANILFILGAFGSMWGRVDGKAKSDTQIYLMACQQGGEL